MQVIFLMIMLWALLTHHMLVAGIMLLLMLTI
jgi:hypothetical protein